VPAVALGVVSTVVACSSSAFTPATAGPVPVTSTAVDSLQLIVRFRAGIEPNDAAFLQTLAGEVGAPLIYVRPLSGGFHVVRAYPQPGSVDALLSRLQSRREVSHVELDRPVRHQ
jgi:hypothetical protein